MEHVASVSELPYPNGWFAVAFSKELKPGAVLRRRLMGEEVVVYRTRGGTPVRTARFMSSRVLALVEHPAGRADRQAAAAAPAE